MTAPSFSVVTRSAAATRRVAAALARALTAPRVVALEGDLGAGKTTFTKGFAGALGADPARVKSPTYALAQRYPTTPPVDHLDLYRLDDEDALDGLGLTELLSAPEGFTVVEWPTRAAALLARVDPVTVSLALVDARTRRITVTLPPGLPLDEVRAAAAAAVRRENDR